MKKTILFALAALLTFGLASCSSSRGAHMRKAKKARAGVTSGNHSNWQPSRRDVCGSAW